MIKHLFKFFLILSAGFLFWSPVHAAEFVETPFFINTAGHEINALEGRIISPPATAAPEISDGGSIINFWIERPTAANQYHFSGIIPGGLNTEHGLLFKLTTPSAAKVLPTIELTNVLLNDGKGTALPVGQVQVKAGVTVVANATALATDTTPPETFTPVVGQDPAILGGRNFVSFATQDKQSGLDHYEVAEAYSRWFGLTWQSAASPQLLSDQALHHNIYVKAVDRAGNNLIVALPAPAPLWWLSLWFWLTVVILLIVLIIFWLAKRRRRLLLSCFLIALAGFGVRAESAAAAQLVISTPQPSYQVGQTFNASVIVQTPTQALNAVSGVVSFPPGLLQAVSVSKTNSIINLWVTEPAFDNVAGTVNFEGVALNPGFTGAAGAVLSIQFKVIKSGSASLNFTSGSVLANDGQGTNILQGFTNRSLTLGAAVPVVVPPPPVTPAVPLGDLPPAPEIHSSTHPDQTLAYPETVAQFNWSVPGDVTAVRVLYDRYPNSLPTVTYNEALDHKTLPELKDGVWYFHVQFKNRAGWGPASHYRFEINTNLPPTPVMATSTATSTLATTTSPLNQPETPLINQTKSVVTLQGENRFDILKQIIAYYFTDPLFLLELIGWLVLIVIILLIALWQHSRRLLAPPL